MKELLQKLRQERFQLYGKIRNLEKFRVTKEWNDLSVNHKELLDIQLNAMKTYHEILVARCIDIQENLIDDEKDKPANNDKTENNTHIIEIEII